MLLVAKSVVFAMVRLVVLASSLVFLLECAVADHTLLQDVEDFVDLLDLDNIRRITNRYYLHDRDFKSMLEYMQDKDFNIVWNGFFSLPTVRDLGLYLTQEGVPFYDYVDVVANFIGQAPVSGRSEQLQNSNQTHHGLKGYAEELYAALPFHAWSQLYEVKLSMSPPFKALTDKIRGVNVEEFKCFYKRVKEARSFVQILRSHGIDVELLENTLKQFLVRNQIR